jgi:hypothetical protein
MCDLDSNPTLENLLSRIFFKNSKEKHKGRGWNFKDKVSAESPDSIPPPIKTNLAVHS